jgi:nucleotide-binding universal stress UspA family protein
MGEMAGRILAVLNLPGSAVAVLAMARLLAARLGAEAIDVLHVRHDVLEGFLPSEEVMPAHRRAELDAQAAARTALLRGLYDAWCTDGPAGDTRTWRELPGPVRAALAAAASSDYLAVLGHAPRQHYEDARFALDAALFDARLPIVLVPDMAPTRLGQHIAVAWKPGAALDDALAAAMPLLRRAERVTVLIARDHAAPEALVAGLLHEGVTCAVERVDAGQGSVGAALLAAARAGGADLLVMGAWTHARWTEFVLGGVTRHMLAHADLPVLMRH